MNRVVKTTIASALVLSMALSGTTAAMAAAPAEEENCISAASIANWAENTRIKLFNKSVYAKYNPGVTVEKDENSPTGYTVTFIYKERKSYTSNAGLTIDTTENPLTKVELYSDCFMLFDPASGTAGSIDASLASTPYQYAAGLAPPAATVIPLTMWNWKNLRMAAGEYRCRCQAARSSITSV